MLELFYYFQLIKQGYKYFKLKSTFKTFLSRQPLVRIKYKQKVASICLRTVLCYPILCYPTYKEMLLLEDLRVDLGNMSYLCL